MICSSKLLFTALLQSRKIVAEPASVSQSSRRKEGRRQVFPKYLDIFRVSSPPTEETNVLCSYGGLLHIFEIRQPQRHLCTIPRGLVSVTTAPAPEIYHQGTLKPTILCFMNRFLSSLLFTVSHKRISPYVSDM